MQGKDRKNSSTIKWVVSSIRPYWSRIFILSVFVVAAQLVELFTTLLLRSIIDSAVDRNEELFSRGVVLMFISLVVLITLFLLRDYSKEWLTGHITLLLQKKLFRTLLTKDYYQVTEKHSGEWMNRMVTDCETVSKTSIDTYTKVLSSIVDVVAFSIVLFTMIPFLTVLIIVTSLVIGFIGFILRSPFKKRQHKLRKTEGEERVFFSEYISSLLIIKAFSKEDEAGKSADNTIRRVSRSLRSKIRLSVSVKTALIGARRVIYMAVLIICAYRLLLGKLSFGSFIVVQRLLIGLRDPLLNIGTFITSYYDVVVSADRLREAEAYADDYDGPVRDDREIRSFYNDSFSGIRMDNVAFRYQDKQAEDDPDGSRVFQNVDLEIPKGSLTAVTGLTGSGKSTLFKLLMSLYPLDEGKITLETKEGEPYPLDASFRRLFSYVPQGDQLMTGTIRDIVTFGAVHDDSKDEQIWDALEKACAKDFVEGLAHGLDTELREKGLGLSGGQLQRLAITRAVYTDRPIMLLDEATSSLDEKTEAKVLQNINSMENRTILIATHRPRVLTICSSEIHIEDDVVTMKKL